MKKNPRSFQKSGFTLVELLVVIAIMTIITSIAVFSDSQFNSSVILSNLAYEVALSVREAQDYGISVHSASSGCSGESCFDYIYGVDFNINNPTQYTLFSNAGTLQNGGTYSYDYTYAANSSNLLNTFTIGKGFTIKKILLFDGTNWHSISNSPGVLDVSFLRPDPNAYFYVNGIEAVGNEVEICVQDPGKTMSRAIQIGLTGQISVVIDASCDNND